MLSSGEEGTEVVWLELNSSFNIGGADAVRLTANRQD